MFNKNYVHGIIDGPEAEKEIDSNKYV